MTTLRTTICHNCKGVGQIDNPHLDRDWIDCPVCDGNRILFDGRKLNGDLLPTKDFNHLEVVCCKYKFKGKLPDVVLLLKRVTADEQKIKKLEEELRILKNKYK